MKNSYSKKIAAYLLKFMMVLFLGAFSNDLSAQGNSTSVLLRGTWNINYGQTKGQMSSNGLAHLNGMPANKKTNMETSYANRQYVFNADGTFTIVLPTGNNVAGTWTLTNNDASILLTVGPAVKQYDILYLNGNSLGLNVDITNTGTLLYPELHLTK
ncbi:MAG: lipocalin family protein [Flavobacteriaceae bacterium]